MNAAGAQAQAELPHPVFSPRAGCSLCGERSSSVLSEVDYHDTLEANRGLPNLRGRLYECAACGIAFPSHVHSVAAFPSLYSAAMRNLEYLDRSVLQRIRKAVLRGTLRDHHRRLSGSRLLDAATLRVLQLPIVRRPARGLRVLDVGCGFGEFLEVYRSLGNVVAGTEVVPELAARLRQRGFDCRDGALEDVDFGASRFDVIILRAVFYRTTDPAATLRRLRELLAPGGEIAMVDPCPDRAGLDYFFRRQFPQGQLYILDRDRYFTALRERFGMQVVEARLIYGRPSAPLKSIRLLGHLYGLAELLAANLLRRKPYFLSYNLRAVA